MSLQVWLPLNGNLQNKGLNGDLVPSGTAYTVNNAGKTGSCITTTSSGYIDLKYDGNQINSGSISFGGWFKFNQSQITSLLNQKTFTSTYKTATVNLIGNNSYNGISLQLLTNDIYTSGSFSSLYVLSILRTSSIGYKATSTYELPFDTWVHIFLVYNRDEEVLELFIDGEKKYTIAISTFDDAVSRNLRLNWGSVAGGNAVSIQMPFDCNDVRIYDHALSLKEVKEISKGLILHYPLNDKYIEPTTNLITTEDCLSSTCYNAAISKYGYGTNTDIYKIVTTYDSRKGTKVYMGTDGNNCFPYVYVSNMYTSDGTNSPAYKTLSFDYYGTIGDYLGPYPLGNGNGAAAYKVYCEGTEITGKYEGYGFFPVTPNKWNHIEITFHGTTSTDAQWGYIRIGRGNHVSNTSNFWFFANMQLEVKDHATPYAGIGGTRSNLTVYDTSGYEHNGTASTGIECNVDTPRYDVNSMFNGIDSYITRNTLSSQTQSVSFWVYLNDLNSQVIFTDANSHLAFGIYNNYIVVSCLSSNAFRATYPSSILTINKWLHIVLIKDIINSIVLLYLNGQLQQTGSASDSWTSNISNIFKIGARGNNTTSFNGRLSDFRAYATALTQQDILQLYHTSAIADKDGNLNIYQYNQQNNKKQFLKQNISSFEKYTELQTINSNIMPNSVAMELGSANASVGRWRLAGTSNMTRSRVLIEDSPIGKCYGFQSSGIQKSTTNDISCYGIDSFPFQANTNYVISFYARKTEGTQAYVGFMTYNSAFGQGTAIRLQQQYLITPLPQSGKWIRCWQQFTTNSTLNRNIYIGITTGTQSATAQMCAVKIQKGTIPSQWQPKEEDENYEQYRIKDNTVTINKENCIFANSFYEI